jgi:Tol biopolymer transport system component
MSDDLDLRGIDQRHEPDPEFRAALERRIAAIVAGSDPGSVTESREIATIGLEASRARSGPRRHSGRVTRVVLAIAAAAAVVTTMVVVSRDHTTAPSATIPSGWVAFAARDGEADADIYLVREGSSAHRIAGSDADAIDQVCPAFSPDGTRLAYGQATGTELGDYQNALLVIADLTADGVVSASTTIALEDMDRPPCATWSADGRWVAFGAGTFTSGIHPPIADQVSVVDTETAEIRNVPADIGGPSELMVSDFEWAPDTTELYIAQRSGGIGVYSVATNQTRALADSRWNVEFIALAPDGDAIAVQGRRSDIDDRLNRRSDHSTDLRLMDIDGTGDDRRLVDRGVIALDFEQGHGIGPVWSPDGTHLAFQRVCGFTPDNHPCSEQHEVVVVTVNDSDSGVSDANGYPLMLDMPQGVIPPPETTGPDGTRLLWYPYNVTWSPDSTTLLYGAWAITNDEDVNSLVAVPVDGDTPPVALFDGLDLSVYGAYPRVPFHSWSH